jgi:proteasome endopeptidase complex, beta component (EC 3.4.25.1). Threonine peptidase. MEROPS family T01A
MEELKTGTTTLAMVVNDGVVVGADRRVTAGYMVAHKVGKKIYQVDDKIALTTAGLVGDLQMLVRYVKAEAELYKYKKGVNITVEGLTTLLANILNQTKYMPFLVQIIIAGYDKKPHVFSIDEAGGAVEDKYVSTGSGSPFVYGVLEDLYEDGITIDQGIDIAIRAISTSLQRDAATGNGIDIVTITSSEGYKQLPEDDVQKRIKKLKI